jgi:hypothetical protein
MAQLARPFCVYDGATTNCQIGPAPEIAIRTPRKAPVPYKSLFATKKSRHHIVKRAVQADDVDLKPLLKVQRITILVRAQILPDHTLPFWGNQDFLITYAQFLYVFSVTHRCHACACRRPPDQWPTCTPRYGYLPNARLRNGTDR